jgi:hypothetical protein
MQVDARRFVSGFERRKASWTDDVAIAFAARLDLNLARQIVALLASSEESPSTRGRALDCAAALASFGNRFIHDELRQLAASTEEEDVKLAIETELANIEIFRRRAGL